MSRKKIKMIKNLGFKLWYTKKSKTKNEVGIIIDKFVKRQSRSS